MRRDVENLSPSSTEVRKEELYLLSPQAPPWLYFILSRQ
jgi:hypothetical protein